MNFKEFSFQGNWNADFQLTHQMKKTKTQSTGKWCFWDIYTLVTLKKGTFKMEMLSKWKIRTCWFFLFPLLSLDLNYVEILIHRNNSPKIIWSLISFPWDQNKFYHLLQRSKLHYSTLKFFCVSYSSFVKQNLYLASFLAWLLCRCGLNHFRHHLPLTILF